MKKFLFITSYFPPLGGPGVQRQLYYVHYARQSGWQPVILAPKDIAYHIYDPSLLAKVPEGTRIERTESLEFGRLLWHWQSVTRWLSSGRQPSAQPAPVSHKQLRWGRLAREWVTVIDDRLLWIPFAYPRAVRLVKEEGISVIAARGGPHSNTLLGYLVAAATGKPLVLDLADPWTTYPYFHMPTRFHRRVNEHYEGKVYPAAARIAASCPSIKADIHRRFPDIPDQRVVVVTNGFDQDAMQKAEAGLPQPEEPHPFTIAHVGSLTWIRRQALEALCAALVRLRQRDAQVFSKLQFRIVGACDSACREALQAAGLAEIVSDAGYLPHLPALQEMQQADLLFLPVSEDRSNPAGTYVVPGKLYEYLGSGTPVLMIGPPESDAARLILDGDFGRVFQPAEVENIAEYLCRAVLSGSQPGERSRLRQNALQFERGVVARKFLGLLDEALKAGDGSAEGATRSG